MHGLNKTFLLRSILENSVEANLLEKRMFESFFVVAFLQSFEWQSWNRFGKVRQKFEKFLISNLVCYSFLENGFKLLFDLLRPFWIRIFENFECFEKYFPLKLVGYRFLHQASYKSWNSLKSQNIFSWDYKISMSNLSLKNDNLLNLVTT